MTRVTIDANVLAKLKGLNHVVELCDDAGRVVGLFTPVANQTLYEDVEVPFTSEELDRFENEPGGLPLKDILTDLENNA